jgi:hypothetical protein
MSEPDPRTTLREFKDYFAGSYETAGKLAKRVGITNVSLRELLAGHREPSAKTIAKMRLFLDAEAKRNRSGDGIKPTEPDSDKDYRAAPICFPSSPLSLLQKGPRRNPVGQQEPV